jgi:CheY-like chemotaxis protein
MSEIRVLVIDDDDVVRELMCDLLRKRDYVVFGSGSPIGVTKLITQNLINVVVVDVMMPDISGDKLARLLRNNQKMKDVAIVLVSSGELDALTQLAKSVQADAVVPKSELRTQLAIVVGRIHASRQLSKTFPR